MVCVERRQRHLSFRNSNASAAGNRRHLTDAAGLGDELIDLGNATGQLNRTTHLGFVENFGAVFFRERERFCEPAGCKL